MPHSLGVRATQLAVGPAGLLPTPLSSHVCPTRWFNPPRQGLPYSINGVGDLLALFRCISCKYKFATDPGKALQMGAGALQRLQLQRGVGWAPPAACASWMRSTRGGRMLGCLQGRQLILPHLIAAAYCWSCDCRTADCAGVAAAPHPLCVYVLQWGACSQVASRR